MPHAVGARRREHGEAVLDQQRALASRTARVARARARTPRFPSAPRRSCEHTTLSTSRSMPVCSAFTAKVSRCAFVTIESRLPRARTLARNSCAPGRKRICCAVLALQRSSSPCRDRASNDRGNTTRACRPCASKRGASDCCAADTLHAVQARVALRHDLAPEEIVEVEIEQRAVHVDEHGVDAVPIDDGCGCLASCRYDTRRLMTRLERNNAACSTQLARSPAKRGARFSRSTGAPISPCTQERRLAADGSRPSRAPHHQRRARRRSTRGCRSCRRNRCRPITRRAAAGRAIGSSIRSTARRSS